VGFSLPELMLSDFDSALLVATTFGWLLQFPSSSLKRVARPFEIGAPLCAHFISVTALGNSTKRTRLFIWPIFYYLFVFLRCYFCFRSVI
jgi:hypothetical protein